MERSSNPTCMLLLSSSRDVLEAFTVGESPFIPRSMFKVSHVLWNRDVSWGKCPFTYEKVDQFL